MAAVNHVVNGDFETGDLTGWTVDNGGQRVSSAGGGYTLFGEHSVIGGSSDSFGQMHQWVPVPAGAATYRFSLWDGNFLSNQNDYDHSYGWLEFYEADQATLIGSRTEARNRYASPRAQLLEAEGAVPAGAAWAKVYSIQDRDTGTANNTCSDEVWLQFDPEPTEWPAEEPLAADVVSRAGFDGADGATEVLDFAEPAPTWLFGGNARIDTSQARFGVSSLYLPDNTSHVDTESLPDLLDGGSTRRLFRFWVRFSDTAGVNPVLSLGTRNTSASRFNLYTEAGAARVLLSDASGSTLLNISRPLAGLWVANTWHHVTVQITGWFFMVFVDGKNIPELSAGIRDNWFPDNPATVLRLGALCTSGTYEGPDNPMWFDDLQIITGHAPHVISFDPPPTALPGLPEAAAYVSGSAQADTHLVGLSGATPFEVLGDVAGDASFLLEMEGVTGTALVLALEDYGERWQPDTVYPVGARVRPSVGKDTGYLYEVTAGGDSGPTEPAWWTAGSGPIGAATAVPVALHRPYVEGPVVPVSSGGEGTARLLEDGTQRLLEDGTIRILEDEDVKQIIQEIELTTAGEFDFDNIPQGYKRLVIEGYLRGSQNIELANVLAVANEDEIVANYHGQDSGVINGTHLVTESATVPRIAAVHGAAASMADAYTAIRITIEGYSDAIRKVFFSETVAHYDGTAILVSDYAVGSSVVDPLTRFRLRAVSHPTDGLIGKLTLYGEL